MGTPTELNDEDGRTAWQSRTTLWALRRGTPTRPRTHRSTPDPEFRERPGRT
ncbi:hypothetical protein [Streptomyces sp. NPDC046727]|uniref:hypothetical protein n=1 Tax=Streptomyces sp. NPDC046727 TaxID=3155373 RepID=UPI00340E9DC2